MSKNMSFAEEKIILADEQEHEAVGIVWSCGVWQSESQAKSGME